MPRLAQTPLRLTKDSVRTLTHSGKTNAKGELVRDRYRDAKAEGLVLTVHPPQGDRPSRKTWTLRYRLASGKETEGSLGEFPGMDPDAARLAAARYRLAAQEGRAGVVEARRKTRETRQEAERHTVAAVADAYLAKFRGEVDAGNRRASTLKKLRGTIENHIKTKWGKLPIGDLRRPAIIAHMEEIRDGKFKTSKVKMKGGRDAARSMVETLRVVLDHAVEREIIASNPASGISLPEKNVRKQWAKDAEVKALWDRLEAHRQFKRAWCSATAIQLAFLTGKRRAEIAGCRKSEVNFEKREWTIPGERTKNGKDDLVPLTDWTAGILEEAFKRSGCDFAFVNKDRTAAMHPEAMTRIFARERLKSAEGEGLEALETLHLHDSRRLVVTTMAKLKVPPHVIGAILAHTPRGLAASTAIYNVYDYAEEKREALKKWEDHLRTIVEPKAAKTASAATSAVAA